MDTKIFNYSNCVITVHRPKKVKDKQLHKATENFLREVIKNKKK